LLCNHQYHFEAANGIGAFLVLLSNEQFAVQQNDTIVRLLTRVTPCYGIAHMETSISEWFVYVRWHSGRRETIRCTAPELLPNRHSLWVLACLPVPTISVVRRR
jgi:hypothetical protein